jgi:hypothetical protein
MIGARMSTTASSPTTSLATPRANAANAVSFTVTG